MSVREKLLKYKEKYLHAYRTMMEVLEAEINNKVDYRDFNYKMAITRASALDRIRDPLEQLAMDLAWFEQRIRHPFKMHSLVQELHAS
jgi:hypothetical protein